MLDMMLLCQQYRGERQAMFSHGMVLLVVPCALRKHPSTNAERYRTAAAYRPRGYLRAGHLRSLTTCVAHVLPVSDDGGSTAEIVRVLGGPAVGDIRSRCLRLADDSNAEVRTQRSQWLYHALRRATIALPTTAGG